MCQNIIPHVNPHNYCMSIKYFYFIILNIYLNRKVREKKMDREIFHPTTLLGHPVSSPTRPVPHSSGWSDPVLHSPSTVFTFAIECYSLACPSQHQSQLSLVCAIAWPCPVPSHS